MLKFTFTLSLSNSLLVIYLIEMKTPIPKKTWVRMCLIALFLRAESCKHPNVHQKILSTSKQIVVYSWNTTWSKGSNYCFHNTWTHCAAWKMPEMRVHSEYFHYIIIRTQAMLIYGEKNQNSDCIWPGRRRALGETEEWCKCSSSWQECEQCKYLHSWKCKQ